MKSKKESDILAGGPWGLLAFKAVKEAPRVVTLLITTSILKKIPAGNIGSAVKPRLTPVERTVSSIPLAFVVVTLIITHFIPRVSLTLYIGTGLNGYFFALTVSPGKFTGTATTVLVWVGWVCDAGSSI